MAESPIRVREASTFGMLADELFETFDGKSEMRSTLVADNCMNFVENQCPRSFQHSPATFAGQQDIKRLRSRDDNVRRTLRHRRAFGGGRVAGSHERPDIHFRQIQGFQFSLNSFKRNLEIALDVVAEGF